jgi:hypothetical protein
MAHCLAAAEAGVKAGLAWKTSGRDTFMGIDQMGSFNAVIIKERMPDGRQATIHVEAVFDLDPFERCADMMKQYGVAVCVVEQLPNVNDARKFANRFAGRVFLASYADLRDSSMVWGDDLSRSDKRTEEGDRTRYTVSLNQYKCMQTSLYRIKNLQCLFPDPDGIVQDVLDGKKEKRIPLLRDWVFLHFTKTALIVEQDEQQRKPRAKVVKVGIDPHYSYANMLCDVAWARSYGATTFIFPDQGGDVSDKRDAVDAAMPGLPSGILNAFNIPEGDVCGRCVSFLDGKCVERGFTVRPSDQGCHLFVGDDD